MARIVPKWRVVDRFPCRCRPRRPLCTDHRGDRRLRRPYLHGVPAERRRTGQHSAHSPVSARCSRSPISAPGQPPLQGEFYRDDERVGGRATGDLIDLAWNTLPAQGARHVHHRAVRLPGGRRHRLPQARGRHRVRVLAGGGHPRGAGPMASGTPQSFTSTSSVNVEPCGVRRGRRLTPRTTRRCPVPRCPRRAQAASGAMMAP